MPIEVFIEFNSKKFASVVKPNSFIQNSLHTFPSIVTLTMNTQLRKYIFKRKKALGKIHIFKTSSQLSMMHASIGYFYMWFMTSQIMLKKYQICLTVKYLFDLRIFILLIVTTEIYQIGAPLVLNHLRCLLRRNLIFHEWKAHFDHVNWYLATNYVECRLVRLRSSSYTKSAIKRWTVEWTIEIQTLNHRS